MIPHYQNFISCPLEDNDPIFKISRNLKTDHHDLSVPVSPKFQKCPMYIFELYTNQMFRKWIGFSHWIIWRILMSQKINHIVYGPQGHVQKSRNYEIGGFSGSPMSKLKHNNTTEFLRISFHKFIIKTIKNDQTML